MGTEISFDRRGFRVALHGADEFSGPSGLLFCAFRSHGLKDGDRIRLSGLFLFGASRIQEGSFSHSPLQFSSVSRFHCCLFSVVASDVMLAPGRGRKLSSNAG